MIKALSLAAALAFATPTLADTPPQARPGTTVTKSPSEIAFEARTEAFKARLTEMRSEYQTAVRDARGDQARGMAAVDAILVRYHSDIYGFLDDLNRFIDSELAQAPDETTRQALLASQTSVRRSLYQMPYQMRAEAQAAIVDQIAPR